MTKISLGNKGYFLLMILIFIAVVSCERDIENIGVDLVDNNRFGVGDTVFEVRAYNVNVDSSRVDNNVALTRPGYLMGINNNPNFGILESKFGTQFQLPDLGVNFGDNAIIDLVVLDFPYYSTRDTVQYAKDPITGENILDSIGNPIVTPSFELDSIYGDSEIAFQIKISELETFLNVLDPENPTQPKAYYSNRGYNTGSEVFFGEFKPNRNDTVLYVERRYLDGDFNTVDDIDTVKTESASPSMKFELDKEFFKTRFLDQSGAPYFDNFENFVRYFKGLYIESFGADGTLINFPSSNGSMTIYYTYEDTRNEGTDEDLNYNGITGEQDVLVKLKGTMRFASGGVQVGSYVRNNAGYPADIAIQNPDKENGDSKLFVQGAAGSNAIIDLFTPESLDQLKGEGLLINEANLTFYIDKSMQKGKLPSQLFLYQYENGVILDDLRRNAFEVFGGDLEYDEEGDPEKYKFRITNYLSRILEDPEFSEVKLVLKTYHRTDDPFTNLDTLVQDYSWIPKGVVLKGNQPMTDENRLKLEIFYSK